MRGGKRDGAGRKKGALTTRTQEIVAKASAEGAQPLEYMLKVMRDETADEKRRDAMAIAAVTADVKAEVDATHSHKIELASEVARRLGRLIERSPEDEGARGH
jgi:hypothetical protein